MLLLRYHKPQLFITEFCHLQENIRRPESTRKRTQVIQQPTEPENT